MSEKKTAYDKLTEDQKSVQIPYYVHEGEMARLGRINFRLWISMLIVILLLVGTNVAWIIYESQFETYVYEQETRADNAPAVGIINTGEGDVNYNGNGKTESNSAGEEDEQQKPDEGVPNL